MLWLRSGFGREGMMYIGKSRLLVDSRVNDTDDYLNLLFYNYC